MKDGLHIAVVMPSKEINRAPIVVTPYEHCLQVQVCFKVIRERVGDCMWRDLEHPQKVWWYQPILDRNNKVINFARNILTHPKLFAWDRVSYGTLINHPPHMRCCLTLEYANNYQNKLRVRYVDPVDDRDEPIFLNAPSAATGAIQMTPAQLDAKYSEALKGGRR